MKKIILSILIVSLSVILVSCNNKDSEHHNDNNSSDTNTSKNKDNEIPNKIDKKTNTSDSGDNSKSSNKQNKEQNDNKKQEKNNDGNKNQQSTDKNKSYLNNFNSKEIEYARVWYQLISTRNNLKGIRNVYVTEIPKGSKVNPQAQNSAIYKEKVVKLEAPMRAGGSVTYSSNGDGTINVYNNIPYKWENSQNSDYNQMNKITKKAIEENIETVYIKPYDNKTVAKLASKIKYNK
ncbi:hypothetical protein [Staphylococcus hominis]|uniref:hypothetical protein n=1 Tax=Staphylococcus hominis TaxID=1290 RepID=UPI001F56F137|nr:hypothetical protein [Staphylococcus hominis]MCI2848375.1 hypothetical protein [Staphylococcus hominis]MCI2850578.1 hypothetical protein [Staphylococcus hominis]MCI2857189.1 hypothetical protein [Staphylococcus hominis]